MAEATQKDAEKKPLPGSPEARERGRRNLNSQIAQRQKMLLAGIGAIALIGGGMFIFGGDGDEAGTDANGAAIQRSYLLLARCATVSNICLEICFAVSSRKLSFRRK